MDVHLALLRHQVLDPADHHGAALPFAAGAVDPHDDVPRADADRGRLRSRLHFTHLDDWPRARRRGKRRPGQRQADAAAVVAQAEAVLLLLLLLLLQELLHLKLAHRLGCRLLLLLVMVAAVVVVLLQ